MAALEVLSASDSGVGVRVGTFIKMPQVHPITLALSHSLTLSHSVSLSITLSHSHSRMQAEAGGKP